MDQERLCSACGMGALIGELSPRRKALAKKAGPLGLQSPLVSPPGDRTSDMFDRDHAGNGLDGARHLGRDLEAAGQFHLDLTAFAIQQQDQ